MVGENVTEMLSTISVAMKMKATVRDIMSVIFPHPTMSEAIMEAASAIHGEAVHILEATGLTDIQVLWTIRAACAGQHGRLLIFK